MRLRRTRSPEAEQQSRVGSVLRNRLQRRGQCPAPVAEVEDQPIVVQPTPAFEEGPFSDLMHANRVVTRRPRGDDYLHVSDLLSKCLRRQAIVQLHDMPVRGSSLTLTEELTFAQGDAIHDVLKARAVLSRPNEMWGKWRCRCNQLQVNDPCVFAQVPDDMLCDACGTRCDQYVEVPMLNEELYLVGTPDVILWKEAVGAFQITELKSMTHDMWKDLVRPVPDHVLQALFYWYLMRELGYRLTDTVSIFYATKAMVFRGRPYKEFVIKPEEQLNRLDPYIAEARAMKACREGGPVPPRTKCASRESPDARQCEVCQVCFAMP